VLEDRTNPKVCPVCGSDSVTQILCDTLLSAHFRGMSCPSEGVLAFHCSASHVFLLLRNDFKWGEPVSTEAPYAHEKHATFGSPVREQLVMRKLSEPQPVETRSGLWPALSAIFGRQRQVQSLGLQP
jgi:hypothetical protein